LNLKKDVLTISCGFSKGAESVIQIQIIRVSKVFSGEAKANEEIRSRKEKKKKNLAS